MKSFLYQIALILIFLCLSAKSQAQQEASLTIRFLNTANGKAIVKGDELYKNQMGEEYSVSKLKYYISGPGLRGKNDFRDNGYYLIDEGRKNSIQLKLKPGTYDDLFFLLGIDSLRHCSGAQDGDLDPLMDMFWTWNSGYVIFKLEGFSKASSADLGRIEHHIGGYKGKNNVSTPVVLPLPSPLVIRPGGKNEILIQMNLDKYWNCSLRESPVISQPGEEAVKAGKNFNQLFSVLSIQ